MKFVPPVVVNGKVFMANHDNAVAVYGPALIGGHGLSATYFDTPNLTGTAFARIDPAVDFVWGSASPGAGIDAETFSARWTGQVEPQFSETYTFTPSATTASACGSTVCGW